MNALRIDADRIADVAARLDLRAPNREALESVVFEQSQWFDLDGRPAPFECVVDSATGVGKTYILAGVVEYMAAARGMRNFAVICPGRTILTKTIANFTPGHPKSLLGAMESRPTLITADNFNTPAVRATLDDDTKVKIYVFTVQSLTKPTTKQGRKTHAFHEGLGSGFYDHLAALDDLVVLADEQHLYFGPAFSKAIEGLQPNTVIGLTATPHAKTPDDQIIYRYPLAAAIADRWVKTPVIVGRRDDRRSDSTTKLLDGVTLLRYKEELLDAYCVENDLPAVRPVMLVIAKDTNEADEYATILGSAEFDGGRWADTLLTVHSNLSGDALDDALEELAHVDEPGSGVRIILSVGMLKEGWDAKNVYVIASMRASVSQVLTEQTLGRGLRLPFGKYTGVEMLDTLEVVAHERYEDLLRSKGVLNEQFIDKRTRAVLRQNARGQTVVVSETEAVTPELVVDPTGTADTSDPERGASTTEPAGGEWGSAANDAPSVTLSSVESRASSMAGEAADLQPVAQYAPRVEYSTLRLPRLVMGKVEASFSLADIIDLAPFTQLGRQLAASPESELQRTKLSAKVVTGRDGLRRTELVTATAVDRIEGSDNRLPLDTSIELLTDHVIASPVVPSRPNELKALQPILKAFLTGLGPDAEHLLSAYADRAAARLVRLITDEHRRHLTNPRFAEVLDWVPITGVRESKRKVSLDPHGPFSKSLAYDSRQRSVYEADWFDSATERAAANIVDASTDVRCWVRLLNGDMSILWRGGEREYNADLVVVENSGDHWVLEVKADRDMTSAEVLAKRTAAIRWVQHVNADSSTTATWHYLLISETDIVEASGSWAALKALGV